MDSAAAPEDDDALAATQEEDGGLAATQEEGGGETDDESASWGKLLSADGSVSLDCEEAEHSVGRAPTCSLVLASQRVSALHARLRRGTPPTVEDCSTNGVWHNGARIGKGNLVGLHDKDTLAFGCAPGGGGAAFTFAAGASALGAGGAAAGSSSLASEDHISCSVCQDILHNAVSLQPCLHSFCAGCVCGWLKQKKECPQCRCCPAVSSVSSHPPSVNRSARSAARPSSPRRATTPSSASSTTFCSGTRTAAAARRRSLGWTRARLASAPALPHPPSRTHHPPSRPSGAAPPSPVEGQSARTGGAALGRALAGPALAALGRGAERRE